MNVTFITSNKFKLMLLRDYLKLDIKHANIDLDEIQSTDGIIKKPVLVEDNGLQINCLGKLPGPFIKWFLQEIGIEKICRIVAQFEDKSAVAAICYGYYDGKTLKKFYGQVKGSISSEPRGEGHGWNPIFIPDGEDKTYAEADDEWFKQYGLRAATVLPELKKFLADIDK
jgi:non-canonical purine NTP pyrophosphatase (RdgB/HAM1 family)